MGPPERLELVLAEFSAKKWQLMNANPNAGDANNPDPWLVLDRFVQELQGATRSSRQFQLLLKAISDSLGAEITFLYTPTPEERLEIVGQWPISSDWCRRFTERVLAETPDSVSHLVRSDMRESSHGAPAPRSVVMVQVSKSKRVWAVALSFDDKRIFDETDIKIMLLTRRVLSYHYQQLYTSDELKNTLLGLVYCLTASIDAKDPYTSGHSERVARIAVRVGQEMGLSETSLSDLYLAGLLHDIGKIGIKDSVLQKPGKLTEEEMLHVQEHPVIGDRIISNVKQLSHLRAGVRNHHERYDGTGYPDRLEGEAIPLMARILAVADSCDAMMSPRPYRLAIPTRQIEAIASQGAGGQWDPVIVRHFLQCRHELFSICQRGIGESVYVAVENAVRTGANRPSWEYPNRAASAPNPQPPQSPSVTREPARSGAG